MKIAFFVALFMLPVLAIACPPGSILQKGNGWEGCTPPPPPSSSGQWADRWGAIATDPNGGFGSAVGERSKRKATTYAVNACKNSGGTNCRVNLTYYNQCASVVIGSESYFVQSAASEELAIANGMRRCQESDKGCEPKYSDCSPAEKVN